MTIGIIGAGFTGLAAAWELTKQGHHVTLFEKDSIPGGLAVGYKEDAWDWTIEKHYHHWFTNDQFILGLAKEINYPVQIVRPKTSAYIAGQMYQLDSPLSLLAFPTLPLLDKLRMAAVLGFLRLNPWWRPLEQINANAFLTRTMGKRAYAMLWESQLRNKMGRYADDVSLVWFWSRIKKRTSSLAYPEKGFLPFAHALVKAIEQRGGTILFNTETKTIEEKNKQVTLSYHQGPMTSDLPAGPLRPSRGVGDEVDSEASKQGQRQTFDRVIVTLPSFLFLRLAPQLPEEYKNSLVKLKGLGATNLVLRLDEKFLTDNTYWLSICEPNAPIMVVVEHTNFMNPSHFNNEHLVYIGNYPPAESEKFALDKDQLLKLYDPLLEKIHPGYRKHIIGTTLFKAPFAQPIVPTHYSKMIPPIKTPLPHVYLANIEQVYPWDRGTNYAVELGQKVARLITDES